MNSYMDDMRQVLARAGLVRNSSSDWIASFAIGAGVGLLAGATLALLITPSTGQEMRGQLGTKAKQLAQRTQGALADVTDTVKGSVKSLTSQVADTAERSIDHHYRNNNEVPMG